jgi:hypothetical protein
MESPESWFHHRATFYVEAQILFHLNQVGVLNLLNKGGSYTAPQIADRLHLDAGATDALLDYVFEVDDLLERDRQDKYSLSEFGKKVVDRFSHINGEAVQQTSINMFDVRVGAYGPVWQNLSRMLSGSGRYGEDFNREGKYAENGVFKLAGNFWNSLTEHVEESNAESIVEVGLTGLLEKLGETYPQRRLYGLDKNKPTIQRNAESAGAKKINNIQWLHADYFEPECWCRGVEASGGGLIYSLHFHELIARGEEHFVNALRKLRDLLPNWTVIAFEQPRLPHSDKESIPETLWLYSQSNILIHHLIGNGRILSRDAWIELGTRAGCRKVSDRACNYLGYRAFTFQL